MVASFSRLKGWCLSLAGGLLPLLQAWRAAGKAQDAEIVSINSWWYLFCG